MSKINVIKDTVIVENKGFPTGYNREYKSSVFADLFSTKEKLLELYKVLHEKDYWLYGIDLDELNIEDIEIINLEPVVINNIRNDVAFMVKGKLIILVEHQSTINENMPARMLFYFVDELRKHSSLKEDNGRSLHKRKLVHLPAPEFYVVYTGNNNYDDELRLSNAFGSDEFIELKVKVIKEADVHNPLGGYLEFVKIAEKTIDKIIKTTGKKRTDVAVFAIAEAIQTCIDKGILVDYLKEKEEEIINMYTTELTFEDIENLRREEGLEEGREEGEVLGVIKTYFKVGYQADKIVKEIIDEYNLSQEEANSYLSMYQAKYHK